VSDIVTMPGQKDKKYAFRITDRGAIEAVLQTTNALMHISISAFPTLFFLK
jgi:hypothetical protein